MRSLLYVPADNARFVARAHERGADAVILDLEDGVAAPRKDAARAALAAAVPQAGQGGARVFVRVNAGRRQLEDAAAARAAGAFGLVVPKVRTPDALAPLAALFEEPRLLVLVEDPGAVLDARAIAGARGVMGLALGSEDFALALGAEPTPEVLRHPKLLVHYAARAAGRLSFGLLRSIADYADLDGVAAAAEEARRFGFDGATCIHPAAVPVLNAAFSPTPAQLAWAERVLAAAAAADAGSFTVDGRMVDAPVLARARAILGRG